MNKGEIIIYKTPDGDTQLDVKLHHDTVWLSPNQIADLFGATRTEITTHLKNIFNEGELDENSVSSILEHTDSDRKKYNTGFYSLDAILSVGYRVNTKNATRFRMWADKVLKEYLINGFVVNKQTKAKQPQEISDSIKALTGIASRRETANAQSDDILQIINDYTYALDTLDRYDYQTLEIDNTTREEPFKATYSNAIEAIEVLRQKFGSGRLFGNEKDHSFKSSVNTIYIKPLAAKTYTRVLKKKLRCCYTLS